MGKELLGPQLHACVGIHSAKKNIIWKYTFFAISKMWHAQQTEWEAMNWKWKYEKQKFYKCTDHHEDSFITTQRNKLEIQLSFHPGPTYFRNPTLMFYFVVEHSRLNIVSCFKNTLTSGLGYLHILLQMKKESPLRLNPEFWIRKQNTATPLQIPFVTCGTSTVFPPNNLKLVLYLILLCETLKNQVSPFQICKHVIIELSCAYI